MGSFSSKELTQEDVDKFLPKKASELSLTSDDLSWVTPKYINVQFEKNKAGDITSSDDNSLYTTPNWVNKYYKNMKATSIYDLNSDTKYITGKYLNDNFASEILPKLTSELTTKSEFKEKIRGPVGFQGPSGPQGPQGQPGPIGPKGENGYLANSQALKDELISKTMWCADGNICKLPNKSIISGDVSIDDISFRKHNSFSFIGFGEKFKTVDLGTRMTGVSGIASGRETNKNVIAVFGENIVIGQDPKETNIKLSSNKIELGDGWSIDTSNPDGHLRFMKNDKERLLLNKNINDQFIRHNEAIQLVKQGTEQYLRHEPGYGEAPLMRGNKDWQGQDSQMWVLKRPWT